MHCGHLVQAGLTARGVNVVRLNTYTTRQVSSLDDEQLRQAKAARVLAVASPSAVKCGAASLFGFMLHCLPCCGGSCWQMP